MFGMKRGKGSQDKIAKPVYEGFLQLLEANQGVRQSYETLLSNLHLLNSTRPIKTVLVTSSQPEEGKTTVAINLSLTMTLAGKKILPALN